MMYTKEQQLGKNVKKKSNPPNSGSQSNSLAKKGSSGSGKGKSSTDNTKS